MQDIANKQADCLAAPSKSFSEKEKHSSRAEPAHVDAQHRYEDTPHALFNDNVVTGQNTCRVLNKEQPHHRLMVLLRARGFSTSEIAEHLGYTPSTVSVALRQPWARQMLVDLLQSEGLDGVHKLLKAELVPSVLALVDVRDAPESKGSERTTAATAIIDRFLGRPTQRVEHGAITLPTDVEELKREVERNTKELERIKAN
jgi:predicted transcriptional regulator